MKNLYEPSRASELRQRLSALTPTSERQWGRMNPAQAMAHCAKGMEMALGDFVPPRMFLGRVIGGLVKPMALGDDKPMKRNSPTVPAMVIADDRDLEAEKRRLLGLIDRFIVAGPAGCTKHPHSFFGPMSPDEWAALMYKHVDHHLRQFGA